MGKRQRERNQRQEQHNLTHGPSRQPGPVTFNVPPGGSVCDGFKHIRISDLINLPPLPAEPRAEQPAATERPEPEDQESGYANSRWNSFKSGHRSKVLFGPAMQAAINERARDFAAERHARTSYERFLCGEMARVSVQLESIGDQLIHNQQRVLEKVETSWPDDRTEAAQRLARKLGDQAFDVAEELGHSKYGTMIIISRWTALGEAIATNGGLDPEQVQMAYDLLAVPQVLRNGSRQVPPANDGLAAAALVKRELARHEANLVEKLNKRDEFDRNAARLGLVKETDKETRKLKSDETRALKRLRWAEQTFQDIRKGVDPAKVIDPDTDRPINPDGHAATVWATATTEAEAATAAPPAPPPPETAAPAESAAEPPPPTRPRPSLPEGCPEDLGESLVIAAEMIADLLGPAGAPGPVVPPG